MKKDLWFRTGKAIFIISLVAFIMVSPQIFYKSIMVGDDISFHFNRIYDLAHQIETGDYNYFQSIYGFNQSGRIVNALYGYDLSYLLACLLLISKTWTRFQIISSFICYLLSGLNMYVLLKYLKISEKLSIILSMLYMSCALISFYALIQSFISWGGAFLPLLFLPAIKAVKDRQRPINPVFLSIPMSLLIATHILSAFIGVLAISPFFAVSFYHCKDKMKWLAKAIVSIGLTVLLSLNSLYSYLEVYLTNNLLSPFINNNMSNSTVMLSITKNETRNLGLIFSVLFIMHLLYVSSIWKKLSILEKIINFVGGLFLFVSSNLVPWNTLASKISFFSTFQFPMRFSIIAYILILSGIGLNLERLFTKLNSEQIKISKIILLTGAVISIANVNNSVKESSNYWLSDNPTQGGNNTSYLYETDPNIFRSKIKDKDLTKALDLIRKGTSDYLPIPENLNSEDILGRDPYTIYKKEVMENPNNVKMSVTNDSKIKLEWFSENNNEIVVPIAIYSHSTIILNGEKVKPNSVKKSDLGFLKTKSKVGNNIVVVGYKSTFNMSIILTIKLITILFCFIYIIVYVLKLIRIE
ncbi:hypothetical protein [Enterococcus sp. DIV0756]|uniref:hypothetical protein n=1 Tax=Enterococcus sp. DIV0756 TaxID=2774636 RepID=UPI003F22A5AF